MRVVKWMARVALRMSIVFVVLLLLAQLVPYGRDHDNPEVIADAPWPSAEARKLAVAACYDCHSNETVWPWYSHVAPMSWLVQRDVDRGRKVVNFSVWPPVGDEETDLADSVEDGTMPPRQYLLNHPAAKLDNGEKARLIAALEALEASGADNSGPGSNNSGRG